MFYPTAIGWLPDEKAEYGASQHSAWETMMRSHAIANGVFVAAANRTGSEGQLEFWGASFVADPNGNVLARAAHDKEETLLVECDLRPDRRRPHALAVPARPADRRLWRPDEALSGLTARCLLDVQR